jgi:pimeloyl-ACP methyl ester carboxylesterase
MYNVTDPVHSSIVFVHGLTGSSDTWLHKQSATHWPRDLLPQCFSDAHILQFVYDADVLRLWHVFEREPTPKTGKSSSWFTV